jgi:hypothetical protein
MADWVCAECASVNSESHARCTVCATLRPHRGPVFPEAAPGSVPLPSGFVPLPGGPGERSGDGRPWLAAGIAALLVAGTVAVVLMVWPRSVGPALVGRRPAPPATASATPEPSPSTVESPAPPSAPETAAGAVTIDPATAADPRARPVATMLDTYFSGVNQHDAGAALSVVDPRGPVDPNDPDQVADFARAIATTSDTDIVLHAVGADPTGRGAVRAAVSFRSHQSPGYGPKTNTRETCTAWRITYVLSEPDRAAYRILASSATHQPC